MVWLRACLPSLIVFASMLHLLPFIPQPFGTSACEPVRPSYYRSR
jgi:hypothetical protein